MSLAQDLLATPILGPWVRPSVGSVERRRLVYATLVHWYEAAKFMPHGPELRNWILESPTVKEARKYAKRNQASWRTDWALVRHSALIAGLGLLALQRPQLGLRTCELEPLRNGLRGLELPERFVGLCLERFDAWRKAPRITVFGADAAPADILGARMVKLVSALPAWTLVAPCHRRAPWRVHDWALTHYVPVEYHGGPDDRSARPLARALIAASDQVVVFEQRGHKRFDHVIQEARATKRKVSLEVYALDAQSAGQLTIS